MNNCRPFIERRRACQDIYGKWEEDCVHQELLEKRCLSHLCCPREASAYYGDPPPRPPVGRRESRPPSASGHTLSSDDGVGSATGGDGAGDGSDHRRDDSQERLMMTNKAICASWAEAFYYAREGKELEHGEDVANRHSRAREIVNADPDLRKECREVAFRLSKCLAKSPKARGGR